MLSKSKTKWSPGLRLIRASVELVTHTVAVAAVLALFWLIQRVVELIWGHDAKFFDGFPIRLIFEGADIFLIVGFILISTYVTLKVYRSDQEFTDPEPGNEPLDLSSELGVHKYVEQLGKAANGKR